MGRHTEFTPEMGDLICEQIAGGKSMREICRQDDMPSMSTVFKWLREQPAFSQQYTRAREAQADALFEEILDIADDARNDWMERNGGEDAAYQLNGESIQRARLRVDARKWMAGKLRPKVYGDKVMNEHSGPDGGEIPVSLTIKFG